MQFHTPSHSIPPLDSLLKLEVPEQDSTSIRINFLGYLPAKGLESACLNRPGIISGDFWMPESAPGKWGRLRRGSNSFEPDFNQIPWNPVRVRLKSG